VYDNLAGAYMEAGETDLAIWNYETTLEINQDNATTVSRLQGLHAPEEGADGSSR
jgi:hypothetical protein